MGRVVRRVLVCALAVAAMWTPQAQAQAFVEQVFGANEGGHWVIGTYYRNGSVAQVPHGPAFAGGAALIWVGRGNQTNIARLVAAFIMDPCVRALGNASGYTWGDTYCQVH